MLLKPIKKRCIRLFKDFLVIIHKNNAVKVVVHKALWIVQCSQCNSAVPFVAINCKVLIKQIVQTAVDVLHVF